MDVGLIQAEDGGAVKRDAIYELKKRFLNVFERAVLIEVLAVNRGDHGDDRRQ